MNDQATSYYMLLCFGPRDADRASVRVSSDLGGIYWNSGDLIDQDLPVPIELELVTDEGEALVPMFNPGILVMRDDMITALREEGVDNLQVFDAVIVDKRTNQRIENYKAVNIVGKVACADLSSSQYVAHGDPITDVDFDSLVIDESRNHGFLMFRLAECVSGIVVADRVRQALQQVPIEHLEFIHPP